jgi:hypothetical protein
MLRAVRTSLALAVFCAGVGTSWALPPPPATIAPAANEADVPDLADAQQYAIGTRRDRIGRIIAPVMINGQGPFRFMLDTGATRTVVAESVLAQLGIRPDPANLVTVLGVSGSIVVATAHVQNLDAGDLHFHDLDLPVLSGPVLYGIDGILGMDGFERMRLSADFVKDRVAISQSRAQRAAWPYSVIPVRFLSERLLLADVYVGRVHAKAIIDTGGGHTLGNAALLAALTRGRDRGALVLTTHVVDATQATQSGVIGRVPLLHLGDAVIDQLDVTFGDFHIFKSWGLDDQPALLIGMDVLGTLSELTIDYRRKEIQLLPPGQPDRAVVALGW